MARSVASRRLIVAAIALAPIAAPGRAQDAGSKPMPDLILPPRDAPVTWSTAGITYRAAIHSVDGRYVADRSQADALAAGRPAPDHADGVRIQSKRDDMNGILADGRGAAYVVRGATIELSGNGSNDFAGLGAGVMARGGTLVVRDSRITTHGLISSAAVATNGGTLRVYDSALAAHGPPLPAGYKPRLGAGMLTPPPGLGIGGTARASITLDNAESYFVRSTITADGWGGLSTDGAHGYVYVQADDCDIRVAGSGYGTYADYGAHVVINRSRLESGAFAGIIAGGGVLALIDVAARAGGSGILVHSVMRPQNEVGVLTITGGSLASTGPAILVRSANADVTLDHVSVAAAGGVLLRAVVNLDAFATRVTGPVPGNRLRLRGMTVAGDVLNEDHQRALRIDLAGTTLTGRISNAMLAIDASSRWVATGDSTVTLADPADVARIDAAPRVTVIATSDDHPATETRRPLPSGGVLIRR